MTRHCTRNPNQFHVYRHNIVPVHNFAYLHVERSFTRALDKSFLKILIWPGNNHTIIIACFLCYTCSVAMPSTINLRYFKLPIDINQPVRDTSKHETGPRYRVKKKRSVLSMRSHISASFFRICRMRIQMLRMERVQK